MAIIAVTGGIGAGKSALFAILRERGYAVTDADELAREVVALDDVRKAITAALGGACYDGAGNFDRAAVRALVFADPAARARLEAITHPAIAALFVQKKSLLARVSPHAWLFYEAALIFEANRHSDFDAVVVVTAPLETRLERLAAGRNIGREQAMAVVAAQISDESKVARAHFVVDNSGSFAQLEAQADALVAYLRGRFYPTHS